MKTPFEQVAEFHLKFGLEYQGAPRELASDMALFRIGFMIEELGEYALASGFTLLSERLETLHGMVKSGLFKNRYDNRDRVFHNQLDALVDLVYVANGTAYLHGFNLDGAYNVVHEANMKKVRVERLEDSKRGSKYDVVKPEGWLPPDLSAYLK